jgi:D-alanyl-D-alanine carboxypeptidase (penicillin-binding protein 5/6)
VLDAGDGHVLYRWQAKRRRPIASTTKLMTALLTLDELPLGKRIEAAPYAAGPAESLIGLRPGERMAVRDLLRALLLESANDAAVTLARGAAGSVRRFVARMNARARKLHLSHTHYSNPVGLDEAGNYSSALDLARLARELLRNRTFAKIVNMPRARLRTGSHPRVVDNRNDLVARIPWIDGVKTGHTSRAGYVLVGAGRRKGVRLVSAVLGAPSESARDVDTLALLDYGFGLYRRVRVVRARRPLASARVRFYDDRAVDLVTRTSGFLSIRRGQRAGRRIDAPDELDGPLPKGSRVGTVTILRDGHPVRALPLVTAKAVPKAGAARKAAHRLGGVALVGAAIALGGVALRRTTVQRTGARRA